MRQPTISYDNKKLYQTSDFIGGVAEGRDAASLDDGVLSICDNMWFNRGVLTTRLGAYTDEGRVLYKPVDMENITCGITFTDTFAEIDGESARIGYIMSWDEESQGDVRVYALKNSGEIKSMGNIHYSRVSSDSFAVAEHIYFIVGAATRGCGIYALLTRKQVISGELLPEIYECNEAADGWLYLQRSDFYTPVIYINGRGNQYGFGPVTYEPEPYEPEALNLLTGRFKAYFTSDHYSTTFALPISGIDENASVICRLYDTKTAYTEWFIPEGSQSAEAIINGAVITLNFDHSTGELRFFSGETPWPAHLSDGLVGNNLLVIASKSVKDGYESVVGGRCSCVWGSRVFVSGSDKNCGTVYSARLTNPLYFPKDATVTVGDPNAAVTALAVQNDKPIAFKKKGIYRIVVDRGSYYRTNAYLPESSSDIATAETLYSVGVHTEIGCDCPSTLKLCGNRLVWLGSNGVVYVMATTTYGKENNIYAVSSPIEAGLKGLRRDYLLSAVAAECDGYYLLVLTDGYETPIAYVMDYRVKAFGQSGSYLGAKSVDRSLAWYRWKFPENAVISSVALCDSGIVLGVNDSRRRVVYTSALKGEVDTFFECDDTSDEALIRSQPVLTRFKTRLYDFATPHYKKDITELYISASGNGEIEVELSDEHGIVGRERCRLQSVITSVKLMPFVRNVARLAIGIFTERRISLAPFVIGYRPNIIKA